MTSTIQRIDAGGGRVVVRRHGSSVVFSELSSTYPLKLLSPRVEQAGVAVVYALTYGGGLVGGDSVALAVDVGPSAGLVLLTQGSTKVFKTRYEARAARPRETVSEKVTQQHMEVTVAENGALFLLPDPVTCFRSASYDQTQTFRLSDRASLVVLDWFTSGRRSLGEEWAFSRYYSANDVWVGGTRIAKDVTLLEDAQLLQPENVSGALPPRSLMERLAPYSCYATLILHGPLVSGIIGELMVRYDTTVIFKAASPPALIWSLSLLDKDKATGCVVRVAATTTEDVKDWLRGALRGLEGVIGIDVLRRAFA